MSKSVEHCKHCGKEFIPERGNQIYCSKRCVILEGTDRRYRKRLENMPKKICEICGREFTVNFSANQKICGRIECENAREEIWKESYYITKTCEHCGKEFKGYKTRKFCSRECTYKSRIVHRTGEILKCLHCGEEFEKRHKNQKYCGYDCFYDHVANKETVNCLNCGKEIKKEYEGRKYCNLNCFNEHKRKKKQFR